MEWDVLRASHRINKYTPGRGKVRFSEEGMTLHTHVFISHARWKVLEICCAYS